MLRLLEKYKKEIAPKMMKEFGYKSNMAVPKVEKIVINAGFGRMVVGKGSSERGKIQLGVLNSLALLTGQKPALKKAKKSIASFKLREGLPIGAQVTLRGRRMYDFLEKLIYLALPRTPDLRGIPLKSIDNKGNITIGFKDWTPFPELVLEKEKNLFGLEVTIVIKAKKREESIKFLRLLKFPLKKSA